MSLYSWEKDLSVRDVDFLISFRKRYFPEAEKAARQLDFHVASFMIEALITCGWRYDELATVDTRFLRQLRRTVSAESLAKGNIKKTINYCDPVSETEEWRCRRSGPIFDQQNPSRYMCGKAYVMR
jgi:hypothetical protein